MFIEFKNENSDKISIDIREVCSYEKDYERTDATIINLKSGKSHIVENSYTSVKIKINNALKRIAKGADLESELETT